MLERADLQVIDKAYFDIIEVKDYSLVLHSRNTGHYWYLLEQEYNGNRSFLIHHRHDASKPYHPQKNRPSIEKCCEYIMNHDAFHMDRVRKKDQRRMRRFRTA